MSSGMGASGECDLIQPLHSVPWSSWANLTESRPDGTASATGHYFNASPAITAAESVYYNAFTVENTLPVVLEADGDHIIDAGGITSRQHFPAYIAIWLTQQLEEYDGSPFPAFWDGNIAPTVNPELTDEEFFLTLALNEAMPFFPVAGLFADLDDATLAYSDLNGALFALNISITSQVIESETVYGLSGSPNVAQWPSAAGTTGVRGTDLPGQFADALLRVRIGPRIPDVSTDTQAAATAELQGLGFVVGLGSGDYSGSIPIGDVVRTEPAANVIAQNGSTVNLILSLGVGVSEGVLLTSFLDDSTAVPAGAFYRGGAAFAADGSRYVCLWPANDAVAYRGPFAHRADGALIIITSGTPIVTPIGVGMSYRGEVFAVNDTPDHTHNGWPLRDDSFVCMTEISA